MNPVIFSVGSFSLRWYSVLILIGAFLAIVLIKKESKRFNIDQDFIFNLFFWVVIIGFLGARIYYVIFNYSLYKGDVLSIFKIWEGGLAIHGGIIAGFITLCVYCKKNKQSIFRMTDIFVPGLILAQAIGRWGNFFNSEAHGMATTYAHLKSLHIPEFIIKGMHIDGIYYTPTFLYESLICLIGFVILICIRRLKYIKVGTCTGIYLMYYSIFRFAIESMRTDSLMFFGFKAAQLISIALFLSGLALIIYSSSKSKFENLYNNINK